MVLHKTHLVLLVVAVVVGPHLPVDSALFAGRLAEVFGAANSFSPWLSKVWSKHVHTLLGLESNDAVRSYSRDGIPCDDALNDDDDASLHDGAEASRHDGADDDYWLPRQKLYCDSFAIPSEPLYKNLLLQLSRESSEIFQD
jgi:hypothetical protein